MAVLSSECCDHYEGGGNVNDTFDDTKPRWTNSLRPRTPSTIQSRDGEETSKPSWKASSKANSPSMRTYSEGGSLRTQRIRPRNKSAVQGSRSRSKSPGLFGSTFSSRAKQREALGNPLLRSRASSVSSRAPDPARSRTRSLSPRRFRRQSASPARVIPKKDPNNPDGRSRRDFRKPSNKPKTIPIPVRINTEAPVKKINIPIPVTKPKTIPIPVTKPKTIPIQLRISPYVPAKEENIPMPAKISPEAPSRPDYGSNYFSDRYQFEPIGDTLGRSNIINTSSQSYKENISGTEYYSKKNSYQAQSMDTSDNSYLRKSSNTSNNSYSQNSNNIYKNSSQGISTDATNNLYSQNSKNTFDKSHLENSNDNKNYSLNKSDNAYNSSMERSRQSSNITSLDNSSSKSEYLNSNTSVRKSSQPRGPLPIWLAPNDLHQPGTTMDSSSISQDGRGHSQMRRSSSASSKKRVSVTYIKDLIQ